MNSKFTKKQKIVSLVIIVILLLVFRSCKQDTPSENSEFTQAEIRNFAVTVSTIGELAAARSTIINSEIKGDRGKIIYIIEDGTTVKENDILIKLDPTFFKENVEEYKAKVKEREAIIDAREQLLEWEKNQAEQQIVSAEYNLQVAELDLTRLVKGDGPLQLAKLQTAMHKAQKEYEENSNTSRIFPNWINKDTLIRQKYL